MKVKWNRNLDGNSISDQNVSPNRGDAHLSSRFDDGYNDDDDDLVKSRQVFNKSSKKFNSVKASPSSSSKKGVLEEDRKSMAKLSNILGLFKLNPVKCENKSVDTSDRGPHTIRVVRRTYNDNGSNHSLTDPSSVFQTDSRRRRRANQLLQRSSAFRRSWNQLSSTNPKTWLDPSSSYYVRHSTRAPKHTALARSASPTSSKLWRVSDDTSGHINGVKKFRDCGTGTRGDDTYFANSSNVHSLPVPVVTIPGSSQYGSSTGSDDRSGVLPTHAGPATKSGHGTALGGSGTESVMASSSAPSSSTRETKVKSDKDDAWFKRDHKSNFDASDGRLIKKSVQLSHDSINAPSMVENKVSVETFEKSQSNEDVFISVQISTSQGKEAINKQIDDKGSNDNEKADGHQVSQSSVNRETSPSRAKNKGETISSSLVEYRRSPNRAHDSFSTFIEPIKFKSQSLDTSQIALPSGASNQTGFVDRVERLERIERVEHLDAGRTDRSERVDRIELIDTVGRKDRNERSERVEPKLDKHEQNERIERSNHRIHRIERPDRSLERNERSERSEPIRREKLDTSIRSVDEPDQQQQQQQHHPHHHHHHQHPYQGQYYQQPSQHLHQSHYSKYNRKFDHSQYHKTSPDAVSSYKRVYRPVETVINGDHVSRRVASTTTVASPTNVNEPRTESRSSSTDDYYSRELYFNPYYEWRETSKQEDDDDSKSDLNRALLREEANLYQNDSSLCSEPQRSEVIKVLVKKTQVPEVVSVKPYDIIDIDGDNYRTTPLVKFHDQELYTNGNRKSVRTIREDFFGSRQGILKDSSNYINSSISIRPSFPKKVHFAETTKLRPNNGRCLDSSLSSASFEQKEESDTVTASASFTNSGSSEITTITTSSTLTYKKLPNSRNNKTITHQSNTAVQA